jgi:hypothetical protein
VRLSANACWCALQMHLALSNWLASRSAANEKSRRLPLPLMVTSRITNARLQTCELEVRLLNNGNKKRSREQIRRRGRAFTCLFHYFCVSFDLVRVYWAGTRVYLAMLNFDTVILLHFKLAIEEPASKRARISKVWELPQWVVAFMRLNLETLGLNT